MAITVNYAPAASGYGQAGFMAGRGNYATDERRYRDKMRLAVEELIQNERMQGRQIQASRANTRDQIAANQISQRTGIIADQQELAFRQQAAERQAAFDFVAGQRDRFQQARLQSALGTQEAYQQNWLGAQGDSRQMQMGMFQAQMEQQQMQAEADDRLEMARQQAEAKRQSIYDTARKKTEAMRQAMASGRVMESDGLNYIDQINSEAHGLASGVDWQTEFPTGLTPKQEFKQKIEQQTYTKPNGETWIVDKDGVPRVEAEPPEPVPSPMELFAERQREIEMKEYEQNYEIYRTNAKFWSDLYNQEYSSQLKAMRESATMASENGVAKPLTKEQYDQAAERANTAANAWMQKPSAPDIPQPPISPFLTPAPGTQQGQAAGGQGQFSVPSAPVPPQGMQEAATPQPSPQEAPAQPVGGLASQLPIGGLTLNERGAGDELATIYNHTAGSLLPKIPTDQDRPRVDNIKDIWERGSIPPDLQKDEIRKLGSGLYNQERMEGLDQDTQDTITHLNSIIGSHRDQEDYEWAHKAGATVAGATAIYGVDKSAWPERIRDDLWKELSKVETMARFKRGRDHRREQSRMASAAQETQRRQQESRANKPAEPVRLPSISNMPSVADMPQDLRTDELRQLGSYVFETHGEIGADHQLSLQNRDESTMQKIAELRGMVDYGVVNAQLRPEDRKQAENEIQELAGMYAAYGSDQSAWPPGLAMRANILGMTLVMQLGGQGAEQAR